MKVCLTLLKPIKISPDMTHIKIKKKNSWNVHVTLNRYIAISGQWQIDILSGCWNEYSLKRYEKWTYSSLIAKRALMTGL